MISPTRQQRDKAIRSGCNRKSVTPSTWVHFLLECLLMLIRKLYPTVLIFVKCIYVILIVKTYPYLVRTEVLTFFFPNNLGKAFHS